MPAPRAGHPRRSIRYDRTVPNRTIGLAVVQPPCFHAARRNHDRLHCGKTRRRTRGNRMTSVQGNSSSKSAHPAHRNDASAKIMIVDDEPINIMAVRKYFQDAGFRNVAATSEPRQIMATMDARKPRPAAAGHHDAGRQRAGGPENDSLQCPLRPRPRHHSHRGRRPQGEGGGPGTGGHRFPHQARGSLDLVPRGAQRPGGQSPPGLPRASMPTSWNGKCSCGPPSWRPRVWRSFIAWAGRPNIATTIRACTWSRVGRYRGHHRPAIGARSGHRRADRARRPACTTSARSASPTPCC